jgi:hypothetical protein
MEFALDLVAYLQRHMAWSLKTFGPGYRTETVLKHIRKELVEIEEAPRDLEEWVGLALLAFDGAWRAGYTSEEISVAMARVQIKNGERRWPDWRTVPDGETMEHIRDGEEK